MHGGQLPDAGRVELGATWLHGLKGNPMYELALQYGLMNGSERKQASEQLHRLKLKSMIASLRPAPGHCCAVHASWTML